jgi:hypothetical protein
MKNKQTGGDGYVINVNESIGGRPAFTRYSNNYRPIFNGELLQNGGNGYSVDVSKDNIGGKPIIQGYTHYDTPILNKEALKKIEGGCIKKNKNKGGCGCNSKPTGKVDPLIFDLIKQNGGTKKITQFHAIQKVSYILIPLSIEALIMLIIKIVLNILSKLKPRKAKQLGGYTEQLQGILAPLGKNNLLVLAALLLLHHFAVETKEKKENNKLENKTKKISGGYLSLTKTMSDILAPLGVNALGSSVILVLLQQAFFNKKRKNTETLQSGGNPLKSLIAPLGTNAFIATGILIILQKLFINKINEINSVDQKKKILIGGKNNIIFEDLFNVLAPLTFNAFAKESFLNKMILEKKLTNKKKNTSNKS